MMADILDMSNLLVRHYADQLLSWRIEPTHETLNALLHVPKETTTNNSDGRNDIYIAYLIHAGWILDSSNFDIVYALQDCSEGERGPRWGIRA